LRFFHFFLLLGSSLSIYAFSEISYKVEYVGIDNASALKTIKSITQLSNVQNKKSDSIQALRYRAESDIPEILKVLQAYGYYEAVVEMEVIESKALVIVKTRLGPPYRIASFSMNTKSNGQEVVCPAFDVSKLGIQVGKVIQAQEVIQAELKALQLLSYCGYPLAKVADRSIIADGDTKTVKIHYEVDTGPLIYFGPLSITGNTEVKKKFFEERLYWKEGEIYSGEKVEEAQKRLMDSGLFSSILITHSEDPTELSEVPLHLEVAESKHKSIYGGVSYQTYYGPGLTFGWENRNISGMGRRFNLRGDLTRRSHSGLASYLVPNFLIPNQDAVYEAQAVHLDILPFQERSYQLLGRLERKLSDAMRISFGVGGQRLFVDDSVQNGEYWLAEVPLFLAMNLSNNLLNPTKGMNFEYRLIGNYICSPSQRTFLKQEFSFSYYLPLDEKHKLTLAQKLSGGVIFSGSAETVPVSKRFFGGSEEDLRGYAYYSVSPLSHSGKPEGGRSAIYYSLEARLRLSKTLGIVPFFDAGRVTEDFFSFQGKWLKSAGLGIRYFSFVGPFRLDIGFPLNPREGIDKKYRFLISVGQAF
jgi:translocation and assembly module TamA